MGPCVTLFSFSCSFMCYFISLFLQLYLRNNFPEAVGLLKDFYPRMKTSKFVTVSLDVLMHGILASEQPAPQHPRTALLSGNSLLFCKLLEAENYCVQEFCSVLFISL